MRHHLPSLLFLLPFCALPVAAQSFSIQSGDGQIVLENFRAVAPMKIRGVDPLGRPLVGARIEWVIETGQGELLETVTSSAADGTAQAIFRGTVVPGGASVQQSSVLARTPFGDVRFRVTTALITFNGSLASPPLVELVSPVLDGPIPSGAAGSTLTGAVVVRVSIGGGPDVGQPLPNVGVRVQPVGDPAQVPSAVCRGTSGTILTNEQGLAVCDLVLNNRLGLARLTMNAGEFVVTRDFQVNIATAAPCTFSIQPATKLVGPAGGRDSFNLLASSASCSWTAQSNANWLTLASAASGSGSSEIFFSAASNPGVNQRIGAIVVGGQSLTVSQAGSGSTGALTITTPNVLPNAVIGQPVVLSLQATGGRLPYRWSAGVGSGLPAGLTLSEEGVLSGVISAATTASFTVTVVDASGTLATKLLQLSATASDANQNPAFLTTSFAAGAVGQPYRQTVEVRIGCANLVSSTVRMERTAGSLPAGLELVQAGPQWVIQGTPTETGRVSSFTLRATNPCGFTATADFAISIGTQGTNPTTSLLSALPASLSFEVFQGRLPAVAQQRVSVRSATPISFFAAPTTGWLAVLSGSSGVTNTTDLSIGIVNFESLGPGQYSGSILVSAVGVASLSIPVTLTVNALPALFVSPSQLNFSVPIAIAPVPSGTIRQSFTVSGVLGVAFSATVQTSNGANWLRVTPSTSTSPAVLDVEINHVGLSPGFYTGRVTVLVGNGTVATVPVNLTVNNPPQLTWETNALTFALTPGDSALRPQTIALTSTASSPVRVAVTANTLSGGNWLRVDQTSGTTPMSVVVSVDTSGLNAGQYNGEILARAVDGSALVPTGVRVVLLISETNPVISAVVNAASELPGPVTPGGWAAVRGSFLGSTGSPTPYRVVAGRVDTALSDVRILVDGVPAPILSASSQRTVFQVPYGAAEKQRISVVAEYKGSRSQPVEVPVVFVNPAIFVLEGTQGDIRNEDSGFNGSVRPADIGETVTIFATGEGPTDPAGVDGAIIGTENVPKPAIAPVQVWMDGQEAEVVSAGSVPGMPAGLFQVRAKVPATVTRGAQVPVTLGINGNYSPDPVTIAIKP